MRVRFPALFLIFAGACTAHARVFETRVQCASRYGKESAPCIIMAPGSKLTAKAYNTGDFLITAFFRDNLCVEQRYNRTVRAGSSSTLTAREIAGILAAEGGSQKWEGPKIPEESAPSLTAYTWRTADGRLTAKLFVTTLTITDSAEPARQARDEEERKRNDQRSVKGL